MKKRHRNSRIRLCIILVACLLATEIGIKQPIFQSAARDSAVTIEKMSREDGVFGYVGFQDTTRDPRRSSDAPRPDSSDDHTSATMRIAADSQAYQDSEVDKLGQAMSDQMEAAFGSGIGTQAKFDAVSSEELAKLNADLNGSSSGTWNFSDIHSKITFQIPRTSFPASVRDSASSLYYLEQAISRFPKLCCLFTLAYLTLNETTATFLVYSPIPKDELQTITLQYEKTMNEIMKVITNNPSMTETDKILYLHDEVVAMAEYSSGRSNTCSMDYTPVGTMIYNLGVCQSYSAVFNQAARKAGLTCYVLDSETHAWNALLLDGKWYYVDTTWDDTRSSGQGKDYVKHDYLLVNSNLDTNFSAMHILTAEYNTHFSGLTSQMGDAYKTYFPKERKITSQMGYLGGFFYFSEANTIKKWDRGNSVDSFTSIPAASARRVAVSGRLLYVSGSDGLYQSNADITNLNKVDNSAFVGMYEAANRLYVSTGDSYYIYYDSSTPMTSSSPNPNSSLSPLITPYPLNPASGSPTPSGSPVPTYGGIPTVPPMPSGVTDPTLITPTPGSPKPGTTPIPGTTSIPLTSPSPTPTATIEVTTAPYSDPDFTPPPQTKITKTKNKKSRTVFLKWKKVKGASRYQIQYSTSKHFSTKQMRDSLTNSVKIVNLYKNKTYYFRVRAVKIRRVDGIIQYRYAPWSAKAKKRIKT